MKIRKAHHVVFAWYGILAVFIAITGVIDRIRQKQWLYTLIHVVLVAVIIGILKQIAS